MEIVAPLAAVRGYAPDAMVCADEVPAGRPAPWMNFLNAQKLDIYPMSAVMVVDDTEIGIEAGLNSGAITVAVTQTGNALGLTAEEANQLPAEAMANHLREIEQRFRACGAHCVIRSVAELPELIESLERGG